MQSIHLLCNYTSICTRRCREQAERRISAKANVPLFPSEPIKPAPGTGLEGGGGDGLALLGNISIEKVLRIINFLPVVLINTGLVSGVSTEENPKR